MRLRPIILTIIAGIIGLGAGATLVAFNRESNAEPFGLLYRVIDKLEREVAAFTTPANSGPPTEYFPTTFTGMRGTVIQIPRADMPGTGGGLAVVGDETLVVTFRGLIYTVDSDGNWDQAEIAVPDYGLEAYRTAATKPEYAAFDADFGRLRYNELEYLASPQGRFLFLTFTEFHAGRDCYTLTLARLALPDGPVADLKVVSDDWETIFRSAPCLPLRGVVQAIQGEEAGGRIAFSNDNAKAYLSVGEYGWNGWHSDGLTELSTRQLAQDADADQGKVIEIDLQTLEARHFSSGHRNMQGITVDDQGRVFAVEHGARGGDELNLIEDGNNYGWPIVTYGTNYSGAPIPGVQSLGRHTGFTEPVYAWLPSVGISGLLAQKASFHPTWDDDLLAISLDGNTLFRIRLDDSRVIFAEEINLGRRLRDIEQKDDGSLVIWTDSHEVIFLTPLQGGFGEQFIESYISDLSASEPELAIALERAVDECSVCHSFSRHEQRIGPSLARVHGAPMGSVAGFDYSPAMAQASGRWTNAMLADYLLDPTAVVVGTSMPDPGMDDPAVRNRLVEVLEALSKAELRD